MKNNCIHRRLKKISLGHYTIYLTGKTLKDLKHVGAGNDQEVP